MVGTYDYDTKMRLQQELIDQLKKEHDELRSEVNRHKDLLRRIAHSIQAFRIEEEDKCPTSGM